MDVLVIGAGVAGLAAARRLQRNHLKTLVVDARDRLGGRICTRDGVELGAELLYGDDLASAVENARLTARRVSDVVRTPAGDCAIGNAHIWRLREGSSALVDHLAQGAGPIRLQSEVTRIAHDTHGVTVMLAGGETLFARAVISTLPLAVLRAHRELFDPPLDEKLAASDDLRTASAHRITLRLREAIFPWDGFMRVQRDGFDTFWASSDTTITAYCAGAGGKCVSAHTLEARIDDAWSGLSMALGTTLDRSLMVDAAWHDFDADPFARGGFTQAEPHQRGAAIVLAKPVGLVFFAGEATHATALGTVHGAWQSGERAAVEAAFVLRRNERTSRRAQFRGSASLHRS